MKKNNKALFYISYFRDWHFHSLAKLNTGLIGHSSHQQSDRNNSRTKKAEILNRFPLHTSVSLVMYLFFI